jgi:hypothetical protein
MDKSITTKIRRIAIFYDGYYFLNVGRYYRFVHTAQNWIQFAALQKLVEKSVAELDCIERHLCRVVDAHYFRARANAANAARHGTLMAERTVDDLLMSAGIVSHFRPMTQTGGEKGIDVWFALEAYELAVLKGYDLIVLVTGDADHVPLVRKLHALGTRVLLLYWSLQYNRTDNQGNVRTESIYTSKHLINEVSYSIDMRSLIDDPVNANDPYVQALFGSQPNGNVLSVVQIGDSTLDADC